MSLDSAGVDRDHPDLVAYWTFDAGQGYIVKDETNHGHDLIATQEPNWEVVRWLSTCGNGVVEGGEQCDDGDNKDGNGCSSQCKIEAGWECVATANKPSVCHKQGEAPRGGGSTPPAPRGGGRGGGGAGPAVAPAPTAGGDHRPTDAGQQGSRSSHAGTIAAAILVPVFVFVLFGAAVAYRHTIYEKFPQVEAGMGAVHSAVARVVPGMTPTDPRYAHLALDPEELDISPEFLSPTPARPPGMPGPYYPIPDGRPASI